MNILKMLCRGAVAGYAVDAADFDGTNDYMSRGGSLTGAADSKRLTFVAWFRVDGSNGSAIDLFEIDIPATRTTFLIRRASDGRIQVLGKDDGATTALLLYSTGTYTSGATWRCLMFSVDMFDTAKRHLYIGDTNDLGTVTIYENLPIDFTTAECLVGAEDGAASKFNGCLAELWFEDGVYTDFSVEANRRLFFSAAGKPVDLGADGSTPTGTAPLVYLRVADGAAVATFATNLGTGGNFTITGTLDTASTSPSD